MLAKTLELANPTVEAHISHNFRERKSCNISGQELSTSPA
jgi:hypothetical protein